MQETLYYIYDPMCSWCYAFSKTFEKVKENLPKNLKLVYVLGGLAKHTNEVMPQYLQDYIKENWKKIEEELGIKFNYDFFTKCTPKRDTYYSCKAVLLAREENKEEQMLKAIQEAYYKNAQNPSDIDTLEKLAFNIALKNKNFKTDLNSKIMDEKLQEEFKLRNNLFINSFPSLVIKKDKNIYKLDISYKDEKFILNQIKNFLK